MTLSSDFTDLLCCPETGRPLVLRDNQLVAEGLPAAEGSLSAEGSLPAKGSPSAEGSLPAEGSTYPLIDGMPWLLAHPRNSLLDWGAKLNHFQQVLLKEISNLELDRKSAKGATLDRIDRLRLAKKDFLLELTKLLEPITRAQVASVEHYNALLDRAPSTQNLLSYEANMYRDWQWGQEENALCKKLVLDHGPDKLGKLCVLGAGACRLALDIHLEAKPELTVATDINPLFLLAVNKLISGQDLPLTEFPLHPKQTEYVAIKHRLSSLPEQPDNFHLCFADSAKPPFKKHAFDTLLTPWLIDIQPHEFKRFLRQLNQYLPIGGRWLNFGSLVFSQARESLCYSNDEIIELVAEAGFEIEQMTQSEIPYLKSPYNAGHRIENVWTWSAIKREHVDADTHIQILPDWLINTHDAIPAEQSFAEQRDQSVFLASILGAVDGKTSIRNLAQQLAQSNDGDVDEFERLLVSYFSQIKI